MSPNSASSASSTRSQRSKKTFTKSRVYGKECILCDKYVIETGSRYQRSKETPYQVGVYEGEEEFKQDLRDCPDYYKYIHLTEENLFAQEVKVHNTCRTTLKNKARHYRQLQSNALEANKDLTNENQLDFGRVIDYVDNNVIATNQIATIGELVQIYDSSEASDEAKRQRRSRLKQKLLDHYQDNVLVIPLGPKSPEIVIGKDSLGRTITPKDEGNVISLCALKLREAIKEYGHKLDCSWPPNVEDLMSMEENHMPSVLVSFFQQLMTNPKVHTVSDRSTRIAKSMASDAIYNVSRGSTLTAKHVALSCGIHSMTGQAGPVDIINRLGHGCSYDTVMDIETARAQQVEAVMKERIANILPLQLGGGHNGVKF